MSTEKPIARQSEFLFLYDVKMANQNGDRMTENQPRFDESDNRAIVSDVRIKRTIRDYMVNQKGFNKPKEDEKDTYNKYIFVSNETIQLASSRAVEIGVSDASNEVVNRKIMNKCLDVRLFGAVVPKPKLDIVGCVQFSWSKSLNPTIIMPNPITGGFGDEGKESKTLGMKPAIKYGLFAVYGTINRASATKLDTTEEDIVEMIDSLWHGTNFLKTTSKSQKSRAIIRVVYKENSNYFIGLLDELVSIEPKEDIDLIDIQDTRDYNGVNFAKLVDKLTEIKEHIEEIQIIIDDDMLPINSDGKREDIQKIFKDLPLKIVGQFKINSLAEEQNNAQA